MVDRSDDAPTWAQRAVQAAPNLWVYHPVGENLPPWMKGYRQEWKCMREAEVPHSGRWVLAGYGEALKSLKAAKWILVDAVHAHIHKHQLGASPWKASQEELEEVCNHLLKAPENHRFVVQAGINEAELLAPGYETLPAACATLRVEYFDTKGQVEATPSPVNPQLRYWIAQVQTTSEAKLMVLTTDREEKVDLACPGEVTVWAHGVETLLTLPVPAAPLDPSNSRLGYIIAYCQHHGLILPAYRSHDFMVVRGPGD